MVGKKSWIGRYWKSGQNPFWIEGEMEFWILSKRRVVHEGIRLWEASWVGEVDDGLPLHLLPYPPVVHVRPRSAPTR